LKKKGKNNEFPQKEEILELFSVLLKIDLVEDLRAWENERKPF
jgi:hypothetical protein